MLTKKGLLLLVPLSVCAEEFMTPFEYGQMLYNNPRGVSCAKCHGSKGEGGVIASYKTDSGKTVNLRSPAINNISLQDMISAVNAKHKIMPRYYLTNKEIKIIYKYIQESK